MSQFAAYGDNPFYSGDLGADGGYLPGTSPFSGSQNGSPGGSGGRRSASWSLRPLNIKEVLNATQSHADADMQVHGVDLGQLTVVAQVVSIQSQATNSVYWIDDGSGRIEARQWVDSSNDGGSSIPEGVSEGGYVRVTGALKNFGNKRYINASDIRPVTDTHEIVFHLMETMSVYLHHSRGPPRAPTANGHANGHVNGVANGASAYAPGAGAASNVDQYAHLPPVERKIVEFILQQPRTDEGVHAAAIARYVQVEAEKIEMAIDRLMDEGLVFTTIDDTHFQVSS